MPRHWNNDDDSKDAGASLTLIVPIVLILVGLAAFLFGLLRSF